MLALGSYAAVNPPAIIGITVTVQPDPAVTPSLIHLRPGPFGAEH
jgi:hypothetical protein